METITQKINRLYTSTTVLLIVCFICMLHGCTFRTIDSVHDDILTNEIDSIVISSSKDYYSDFDTIHVKINDISSRKDNNNSDTIRVQEKDLIRTQIKATLHSERNQSFKFRNEQISQQIIDEVYTLFNYTLSKRGAKSEEPIFRLDSSIIIFKIYFNNSVSLGLASAFYNRYGLDSWRGDNISIDAFKKSPNLIEYIPFQFGGKGLVFYSTSFSTDASILQDHVIETFNKLALHYNSSVTDSTKRINLLPPAVKIR